MIKSRQMKWMGKGTRVGKMRMLKKFWSERLKGKLRRRWEDNIRTHLREIVDWDYLAHDWYQLRFLMKMVMEFGFHKRREVS
jgi:hypothetical protein